MATLWVAVVLTVTTAGSPAGAEDDCRGAAIDLHAQLLAMPESGQSPEGLEEAVTSWSAEHPTCNDEYEQLMAYYRSGGSEPFPFAEGPASSPSASPKPFLGPIGWWWNTVYHSWFGGSTVMMVLFGWEIFILPFALIYVVTGAAIEAVRDRR